MAEALADGADCVVTLGGIQSNHARATAVAACRAGLASYLILRTSDDVEKDPGLAGNLLISRRVGAYVQRFLSAFCAVLYLALVFGEAPRSSSIGPDFVRPVVVSAAGASKLAV